MFVDYKIVRWQNIPPWGIKITPRPHFAPFLEIFENGHGAWIAVFEALGSTPQHARQRDQTVRHQSGGGIAILFSAWIQCAPFGRNDRQTWGDLFAGSKGRIGKGLGGA